MGIYKSLTDMCMHVKIETEAAQFLFWENINRIFFAVYNITVSGGNTEVRSCRSVLDLLHALLSGKNQGREEKGREEKGREEKGREDKGRERKGTE